MKHVFAIGFSPDKDQPLLTSTSERVVSALGTMLDDELDIESFVLHPAPPAAPRHKSERAAFIESIRELITRVVQEKPAAAVVFCVHPGNTAVTINERLFRTGVVPKDDMRNMVGLLREPAETTLAITATEKYLARDSIPTLIQAGPDACFCNEAAYALAGVIRLNMFNVNLGLVHLPLHCDEVTTNERYRFSPSLPLRMLIDAARRICQLA